MWLWVRGQGLFVSFLLCGARWASVWPALPVCGMLERRLPGCAVACFS